MKIYVVGNSKNRFLPLDNIREKFLIDQKHEGDNIDFLNPWYCELTGLYYLWKHVDDDIVGLEHYRRYFVNDRNQLLNEDEIKNILKNYDIICTNMDTAILEPLGDRFKHGWGFGDNVQELQRIIFAIRYKNPEMYQEILEFLKRGQHYQFNMFICKKEIINAYCEWMFDIINTALAVYPINTFKPRSIGFVCEIVLFSFWLYFYKKKIYDNKIKFCPLFKV